MCSAESHDAHHNAERHHHDARHFAHRLLNAPPLTQKKKNLPDLTDRFLIHKFNKPEIISCAF